MSSTTSGKVVFSPTRRSNGDLPRSAPANAMRGTRPDGSGSNSPARPKTKPPKR